MQQLRPEERREFQRLVLGGPVAGIASYLVQKMLRDPVDKMIAHEYRITGTWSDPQIAKVAPPQAAAREPGQTD